MHYASPLVIGSAYLRKFLRSLDDSSFASIQEVRSYHLSSAKPDRYKYSEDREELENRLHNKGAISKYSSEAAVSEIQPVLSREGYC